MRAMMMLVVILGVGCGSSDEGGGTASAKAAAGPDLEAGYAKIEKQVAEAKTSDDFLNVVGACGALEIEVAASGGKALAEDPKYKQVCRVAPAKARAALAIAESTPESMSVHCLSAAMNLEELIEAGQNADELKPLLGQVEAACGI